MLTLKNFLPLIFFIVISSAVAAQKDVWENQKLNTAKDAAYMQQDEKDMIYEINRLRSDPPRYAKLYVAVQLKNALEVYKNEGRGDSS